ncbi:MAG: efflux RND transporter permease subunit [Proteobacteria bacterium]|nr:efflux RND transporter permease subunit [Pseudomonadota bacterium]
MDITKGAIARTRVTFVALALVAMVGLGTYSDLPRNLDPGFIVRAAAVITYFPGASPERVEMLISDKLEKVIQEMPELKTVSSTSKTGASVVSVEIKAEYKEMRPLWDDLRRKVESIRSQLPEGIIGPIVLDDLGDVFGVVLTVTGDGFDYAELKEVADQVRDEILHIREVSKVEYYGAQEERVFIEYRNARLAQFGLSLSQLAGLIASQNIINPGGEVYTDLERIVLEPTGNFESVEDLKRTIIQVPGSTQLVALEDIANVSRGYIDPPHAMVYASGVPAIGLGVALREGGNIIEMGDKIKALLKGLQAQYPIGIEFEVQYFLPQRVTETIDNFVNSLIQAVAVVLLVMLVTLGFRTGMLVATLIPMSIVAAFVFMGVFGIGLDQISLVSLIISLGLLVDNAIVMSESILVYLGKGMERTEAAIKSAKELRIPLLVSSLTTAVAFLPIFLAKSATGEYTASIFKVVTITLLCSWVLSMTMTPLLCVLFLKVKKRAKKDEHKESFFYRGFRGFLLIMLRHRAISLVVVLIIFMVAMWGFGFVPQKFFPSLKSNFFYAKLNLPVGTPIARTKQVVSQMEQFVIDELHTEEGKKQGITKFASFIGGNEPIFILGYSQSRASPESAMLMFSTTSVEATNKAMAELEKYCFETMPDVEVSFQHLSTGPPVQFPIEVRVSSRNTEELFDIVDQIKEKLGSTPGTQNISDDWGAWTKKIVVRIDQQRARKAGVSSQDVATSTQAMLSGMTTTQYREQNKIIPVQLRSVIADRKDLGKLESLNIYSQATGKSVPLKQVADLDLVWEPSQILRRYRYRTVTVRSELHPGANAAQIASELGPWLEEKSKNWNIGSTYALGGEDETAKEANESINKQMPVAGFLILMLLVSQFNSMRRTVIVLSTILLGLVGVSVGLLVMDSYFGFMTLLGVVSLAGIVINNAIVLLDRIKIEIEEHNLEPARAVVEAAQTRLRPILLTTATTIGGLIPLYLGGGPMWQPMAVAIMFGLAISTVFTLGVVPTLYAALFRVKYKEFSW